MNSKMTRGVRESGDSKARSIARFESEPSSTMEAETNLQLLLSSLTKPNFNLEELPRLMMMYRISLRLLGLNEEWVNNELKGYSEDEKVPSYRKAYCKTQYVTSKEEKLIESTDTLYGCDEPLGFIASHIKGGWTNYTDCTRQVQGKRVSAEKRVVVGNWEITMILQAITEELSDRATTTLVAARFGAAIDTIFRDYQKAVGSVLSNLNIEDHLETAYRNLKGGDESKWRAAALACRTVLQDLSAKLWCAECDSYNFGGEKILVTSDKVRNRLRAYMHVKGLDRDDAPVALLDPVYAQASAAKSGCSYEDARSVLIVTYLFLAELIRQTDMKPVTEIKKESSKGKG
jgi:hypothetical protein